MARAASEAELFQQSKTDSEAGGGVDEQWSVSHYGV